MESFGRFAAVAFSAAMLAGIVPPQTAYGGDRDRIVTNPIDLNYRFAKDDGNAPRREAADPVAVYF